MPSVGSKELVYLMSLFCSFSLECIHSHCHRLLHTNAAVLFCPYLHAFHCTGLPNCAKVGRTKWLEWIIVYHYRPISPLSMKNRRCSSLVFINYDCKLSELEVYVLYHACPVVSLIIPVFHQIVTTFEVCIQVLSSLPRLLPWGLPWGGAWVRHYSV